MICIARTFGAPDTVPAGKHARRRSNGADAVAQLAGDLRDEVGDVREPLGLEEPRRPRPCPGTQTRERSLRPRSTSITCSARSFSEASSRSASPSPGCGRAGDRVERGARALALDERLGRGADEREAVELEQEEVGRGVDAPERAVERERRRRGRPLRPLREHDLEGVAARGCTPCSATHAGLVARPATETRRRLGSARRTRAAGAGTLALEQRRSPRRVAAQHLGDARARGRSERACRRRRSGSPAARGPSSGSGTVGSSFGDEVVAEVADDRLAAASRPPRSETSREPQPTSE